MSIKLLLSAFVTLSLIRACHFTTCCPDGWMPFQGSCYMFGRDKSSNFVTAENYCRQHGAHLIWVNTQLENNFIKGFLTWLKGDKSYWLGITDETIEGSWKFYGTDTYIPVKDWFPGQPDSQGGHDEDCAVFLDGDRRWHDTGCSSIFEPLCEKDGTRDETEVIG